MKNIVRYSIAIVGVSVVPLLMVPAATAEPPAEKRLAIVWPQEIEKPNLTEIEFTKIMADIVRAKTGAKVSVIKPLQLAVEHKNGFKGTSYLDNAWASSKSEPGHRKERLEPYIATEVALSQRKSESEKPKSSALVPLVKSLEYINQVADASKGAKDATLVTEPLGADLFLVYGFDMPSGVQLLTQSSFHDLGVPRAGLRELAHKNLKNMFSSGIKIVQRGSISQLKADGNYESSFLTNEKYWNDEAKKAGTDIVLVVPSRDTVLYTNAKDTKAIAALKDVAEHVYETGDHVISNKLYRWDARTNKWQLWK